MDIEFLLGAIMIIFVTGIIGIASIINSKLAVLDLLLAHVESIDTAVSEKETPSTNTLAISVPTESGKVHSSSDKTGTPIYLIFANNGERYGDYGEWVVAAFLSKEKAEAHIVTLNNEVRSDRARSDELYTLIQNKEASDEDAAEYDRLCTKLINYHEYFIYEIFDIREATILDA